MDEHLLHEEYYKSVRGEDGEEPLETLGSPPYTDMGSRPYSSPPTALADTVFLPRRPRGRAWRLELTITSGSPEVCPAYADESHSPGPTYGALDCTAELLIVLLVAAPLVGQWWCAVRLSCGCLPPGGVGVLVGGALVDCWLGPLVFLARILEAGGLLSCVQDAVVL